MGTDVAVREHAPVDGAPVVGAVAVHRAHRVRAEVDARQPARDPRVCRDGPRARPRRHGRAQHDPRDRRAHGVERGGDGGACPEARPLDPGELLRRLVHRHREARRQRRRDDGDVDEGDGARGGAAREGQLGEVPAAMLWARAVSQLCRMLFADCFAGSTHTPEEIAKADFDEFEDSAGEPQAEVTSAPGRSLSPPSRMRPAPGEQPSPADTASAAQLKKLNVLVGTLREAGHITTEQVYKAMGRDPVVSEDGELHWSPLREGGGVSLTKDGAGGVRADRTADSRSCR
jgi:hypothetical protein